MKTTIAQKIDEVLDHLHLLEVNCSLFYEYRVFTVYKSIASSLRLLLSGSSGDVGLVLEVLPSGRLLPLHVVPDPVMRVDHLALPSTVRIVCGDSDVRLAGGAKVRDLTVEGGAVRAMSWEDLFDSAGVALPLPEWLQQPFLRPDRTLFDFIKTVGNKDGVAHFNPTADLIAMQRWGHFHWHITAGLARSIRQPILDQITATYPTHTRPVR